MKKNLALIHVISITLLLVISFYVGTKYQQNRKPSFDRTNRGQFAPNGNRGGQNVGEIISSDSNSITVKLSDGSSKIVLLSVNTSIVKSSQATITDLTVGTRVGVFGSTNADGSLTAQNIQINPITRNVTNTPSLSPTK